MNIGPDERRYMKETKASATGRIIRNARVSMQIDDTFVDLGSLLDEDAQRFAKEADFASIETRLAAHYMGTITKAMGSVGTVYEDLIRYMNLLPDGTVPPAYRGRLLSFPEWLRLTTRNMNARVARRFRRRAYRDRREAQRAQRHGL